MDEGDLRELVRQVWDNVDAIGASLLLASLERRIQGEIGSESVLKRVLKTLPDKWDVLMIDCPPSLGLLLIAALVTSGEVLIPLEAHVMPLGKHLKILKRDPLGVSAGVRRRYPWMLPEFLYDDQKSLLDSLTEKMIAPTGAEVTELRKG